MAAVSVAGVRGQLNAEGRLLRRAWRLFGRDAGTLILGSILIDIMLIPIAWVFTVPAALLMHSAHKKMAVVLVLVGMGLCALPLLGGLMGIVIRRVRQHLGSAPRQVFDGYRQLSTLFPASVAVVACLALAEAIMLVLPRSLRPLAFPVPLVGLPLVYLLPTIVDRRLNFAAALRRSVGLLRGGEWRRTLVAALFFIAVTYGATIPEWLPHGPLTTVLNIVLTTAVIFLLPPLSIAYSICMYFRALDVDHLVDKAIAGVDPARSRPWKRERSSS